MIRNLCPMWNGYASLLRWLRISATLHSFDIGDSRHKQRPDMPAFATISRTICQLMLH